MWSVIVRVKYWVDGCWGKMQIIQIVIRKNQIAVWIIGKREKMCLG